jgi:hypothetical protein
VSTTKVFICFYGPAARGENGHAVAAGGELDAIGATDSNLAVKIPYKTLHFLEFTIGVDSDKGIVIYPGNEISQENSHIFTAPSLAKLAGMTSQLGLGLNQGNGVTLVGKM